MEIRVGRRSLQIAAGIGLTLVTVALSLLIFGLVGLVVTPYDAAGDPVLLRPELIATERYRDRVSGWDARLRALHADLYALLSSDGRDLYRDSEAANDAVGRARAIAEMIELASAPPPAMGSLWEQAREAAGRHLDAANLAALWVGSPTDELKNDAVTALEAADMALDELEKNPWMDGEGTRTTPEMDRTGQWSNN